MDKEWLCDDCDFIGSPKGGLDECPICGVTLEERDYDEGVMWDEE